MFGRTTARIWVVLAIVVLAAVDLVGVPSERSQAKPAATVATIVRLPPGWQLNRMPMGPSRTEVALAPDGSLLVFSATPDGTMAKAMLYKRPLESQEASVIPGTEAGCMPFFSPDGQWIGFWSRGRLLKVSVKGGAPSPICDLKARPMGVSWGPDGRIVFGTEAGGLGRVSAGGGTPAALTTIDASKETTHRLPHILPGGQALLFTMMTSPLAVEARIEWLSLETGQRKIVIEKGADARYMPTGHLVFVRTGTLMAIPFNLDRVETTGAAVTVKPDLMQALGATMADMNSSAGQYSVSESGALIWVSGGVLPEPVVNLYWVDRSGVAEKWTAFGSRPATAVRLSPSDGQRLAFGTGGLSRGVWVYDMRRNTAIRLSPDAFVWSAIWTPDGNRLVFSWPRTGPSEIWWAASDGSGKPERLLTATSDQRASSMTRDGTHLAFVDIGPDMTGDIRVLRMADRQVIPFAVTKAHEAIPEFSPDGRWLAYVSNESGRNEVYVRSFPDGKRTLPISSEGGTSPLWAPDGRELFYWNIEFTRLMKVDISPGQNLAAGSPKSLFEFNAATATYLRTYDITPDGRRFLIRERQNYALPPVAELRLVRNWFDELRRLSPIRK
jgi:serine/threonine-protein kinase